MKKTLSEAVAAFIAERDDCIRAIKNCPNDNKADYWRWQGHAEARRVFREGLERDGIDLTAPSRILSGEELRAASEKVDQWLEGSTPEQALRAHIADLLTDVDHFDGCHTMVEGDGTCTCLAGRIERAIDAGRVTEPRQDGAA